MPVAKIVDLSHHYWDAGRVPDFAAAAAAGLAGVIYKASQGSSFRDATYEQTRQLVKDAGLLWGAYHFATSADPAAQVMNFANAALPDDDDLIAIDFERNEPDPKRSVSADTALAVLKGCEDRFGRRPVLYTGSYMYDLFGKAPAPAFAPYRLWWARYAEQPQIHPTWADYWLWQYTDGVHGPAPRNVPGIGYVDCSHFDGSDGQLKGSWA